MLEKRQLLKKYIKCLNEMEEELNKRKLNKKINDYLDALKELQCEVDKRETKAAAAAQATLNEKAISTSPNLPHPKMLDEYITTYSELDDISRELLDAALDVRHNAYAPYSKFKVGAAFRSKSGVTYAGCNIENVAFTPGCCAERAALAKGISEGVLKYTAGAVVAFHPSGFTTPCGVCRQFILEFAKADIPLYIAKAPEDETIIPAIGDDDEILVTSIYNLMPHSFTVF
ncbi:cytidine deaminase [Drosophila tropicalis]|uniref:cytidine deaminase n=1 Tax=Drosophila tropicalis TaxID=46794 RepID=UPI0035ABC4D5